MEKEEIDSREAEIAAVREKLEELKRRVRSPRAADAEPAHVFVPLPPVK